MMVSPKSIILALHKSCVDVLQASVVHAMDGQHHEVSVPHMVLALLSDAGNSFAELSEHFGVAAALRRSAARRVAELPTGNQGRPTFGPLLLEWFKDAFAFGALELGLDKTTTGALFATLMCSQKFLEGVGDLPVLGDHDVVEAVRQQRHATGGPPTAPEATPLERLAERVRALEQRLCSLESRSIETGLPRKPQAPSGALPARELTPEDFKRAWPSEGCGRLRPVAARGLPLSEGVVRFLEVAGLPSETPPGFSFVVSARGDSIETIGDAYGIEQEDVDDGCVESDVFSHWRIGRAQEEPIGIDANGKVYRFDHERGFEQQLLAASLPRLGAILLLWHEYLARLESWRPGESAHPNRWFRSELSRIDPEAAQGGSFWCSELQPGPEEHAADEATLAQIGTGCES